MLIKVNEPPRTFSVGATGGITISDCADIMLQPNEQVTFVTQSGRRYDLAAKSWGFYATPSLNGRLKAEGFRTALVRNRQGRLYIMLVEIDKVQRFEEYLQSEFIELHSWLDES